MSVSRSALLWRLLAASLVIAAVWPAHASTEKPPVVAAAASLQLAMRDMAAEFAARTGRMVEIAFGSSGNFVRQVQQGAPYEMFLSADEEFVDILVEAGLTKGRGDLYALGRLAIIVPNNSRLKADGTLEDLRTALSDGRLKRFAIANPEHAPYGRRAAEALRHARLWDEIEDRLVFGENVAQAAQFATSGNADGGIVAHALALAPGLAQASTFALIPDDWHTPLRQRMVLLSGAGETATMFYDLVMSPEGRAILDRFGFVVPAEGT